MNKWMRELGDCSGQFLNTGQGSCEITRLGDIRSIGIVEKGSKFKETDLKTEKGYRDLVKSNKIYPITDLYGSDQTTPDDEITTSSIGVKFLIRKGLPEFTFTITKGLCAHKKLWSLQGGNWDIILFFEKGMVLASSLDGNSAKAISMSFYNVATYKFQNGTDPEQTTVDVQLQSADEFNSRLVILPWTVLGYDANEINGMIQTNLDVVAKAGTTVEVSATQFCNASSVVLGLEEVENWRVNGVAPSAVTYNIAKQCYILTVEALTLADTVNVKLVGEDVNGILYAGEATTVAIAS